MDWKDYVLIFFILGFLGIPILCLFSIPISLLMGLPWNSLALTILWDIFTGLILIVAIIILGFISGEFSGIGSGGSGDFINAGIGLVLFTLSAGTAFGIWTLYDEIWKPWRKRIWELRERKKALAWELEDQLRGLKEELDLGHITQKEYEEKKRKLQEERKLEDQTEESLEDQMTALDHQLWAGTITQEEYERKRKILDGLTELKLQLGRGDITYGEYHQKKKKLK